MCVHVCIYDVIASVVNSNAFFVVGDYLSFERAQQVVSSQSDGLTSIDRLEGLIMGLADFHVQMNFLKLGYKILFHVSRKHIIYRYIIHACYFRLHLSKLNHKYTLDCI